MSTYLKHSVESERQCEAKRREARERHGRPFAADLGSDYKPHDTSFLTRWMNGEVKLEPTDAQA
jgi:hypothetical protein